MQRLALDLVQPDALDTELPTQVQSNLQVIQNTQLQVQAIVESIDRDRDRRIVLERSIADASAADERSAGAGMSPVEAQISQEEGELETARRTLRDLQARLTALRGGVLERFFVERFTSPPDYSVVAAALARAGARGV